MKKWQLAVASVVAVLLIVAGVLLIFSEDEPALAPNESTVTPVETSTPTDIDQPATEQSFSSDELAISFFYPTDWQTLQCEGEPETIYLASDDRGLGINDDGESILCGEGTDFAPQAVIFQRDEIDQPAGGPSEVTVSGIEAMRYVLVSSGDELRPNGFTTYTYVIPRSNGQTLVAVYNQYPEGTEGYDTSNESQQVFDDIIGNKLELEL